LEVGSGLIGFSFLLLSIWYPTQQVCFHIEQENFQKQTLIMRASSAHFSQTALNLKMEFGSLWRLGDVDEDQVVIFFYLIKNCRRYSKSKSFILTGIVCVVCACYKWGGIGWR
jgi:hypothetical protein